MAYWAQEGAATSLLTSFDSLYLAGTPGKSSHTAPHHPLNGVSNKIGT
jgi:hypothetical protein